MTVICMVLRGHLAPVDVGYVTREMRPSFTLMTAKHFDVHFTVRGCNDNWLPRGLR